MPADLLANGRRWFLDLGQVEVIAEVKLDDRDLGTLWKPPFRVEVTGPLKNRGQYIEVKVVNLWVNRMIGDRRLPRGLQAPPGGNAMDWPRWLLEGKPSPTGRYTFSAWKLWNKDSPLIESGLLGPVTLQAAETVTVR